MPLESRELHDYGNDAIHSCREAIISENGDPKCKNLEKRFEENDMQSQSDLVRSLQQMKQIIDNSIKTKAPKYSNIIRESLEFSYNEEPLLS